MGWPRYQGELRVSRVSCRRFWATACVLISQSEIATDINEDLRTKPEHRNYYQALTNRIPMGRWGVPDDLKGVAVFMASEASAYMTGENIVIDGGWLAR